MHLPNCSLSLSTPPSPKGRSKHVLEYISIGLIHTVSFTKPIMLNISFFLPTCETHMPYSACHALMNTSYFCGCTCRHLFKWKSQWNEMVIKKEHCTEKRRLETPVIAGFTPQIYQGTHFMTKQALSWTETTLKAKKRHGLLKNWLWWIFRLFPDGKPESNSTK